MTVVEQLSPRYTPWGSGCGEMRDEGEDGFRVLWLRTVTPVCSFGANVCLRKSTPHWRPLPRGGCPLQLNHDPKAALQLYFIRLAHRHNASVPR